MDQELIIRWIIGYLFVAVLAGGIFTGFFVKTLRKYTGTNERIKTRNTLSSLRNANNINRGMPAFLMGAIERSFFTLAVAYNLSGLVIGMIGWLTIKMATSWNRSNLSNNPTDAFTGLVGGLVSLIFAIIGGLICNGKISIENFISLF